MKNKLISSIINVSVIFVVFCVVCVFIFGDVFGWFSSNDKVNATGMSVNAYAKRVSVEYAVGTEGDKGNITYSAYTTTTTGELPVTENINAPGDYSVFKLRIKNNSGKAFDIDSVGFKAPDSTTEVPVTVESVNYYLGTQLKVTLIEINEVSVSSPTGLTLLTLNGENFVTEELNFYDETTTLNNNDYLVLTVKLEFIESGTVQDPYKNFGNPDGICKRILNIEFSD